jgi:curli biogenesis system outer membrane secretion channel CsgG
MKIQRVIGVLLLVLSTFAMAKTELVEKTATGYGSSYQEAIGRALFEAVTQVRGATVHSEKQLRADLFRIHDEDSTRTSAKIGVEEKVFTLSKGWVDSYSVKNTKQPKTKDGQWEVTIVAKIPMHQSVIKDQNRQSIAVMPFRFTHATFAIDDLGKPSNAYQISSRIRDRILSSLTQSQQLVVLNRDHGVEFASEKALLSSDNVSPSEASRIGNVAGADFMVVGNIHDLSTETETKSFYGATKTSSVDRVDLSYQVIEVATQKLLWADTISTKIERKKDEGTIETIDQVSHLVVSGVMDVIFPVKVLDISGPQEVYLNQGQARVKEGDVYALFSEGRTLKDPDTGIEIKIDGKQIAKLSVTSVQAKYSVAEVQDGSSDKIKKGDIVRLVQQDKEDIYKNKEVRETPGSSDAPVNW